MTSVYLILHTAMGTKQQGHQKNEQLPKSKHLYIDIVKRSRYRSRCLRPCHCATCHRRPRAGAYSPRGEARVLRCACVGGDRCEGRHPALRAGVPSEADAWISPDRHLLQLAFDVHTRQGAAKGAVRSLGCQGTAAPPT